ncbi:MAG: HAMP domain-containing sensor histidine kinase [Cryomorphaceae bacterium]
MIKEKSHWIIVFILVIISTMLTIKADELIQKNIKEAALAETRSTHKDAIRMVSNSVETFGAIVAGMQAFVSNGDTVPDADQLQRFLSTQLKGVNFQDPVVVSFLDTNHTFVYSFDQSEMNPSNLVGQTVKTFRSDEEIASLNKLMTNDEIHMFEPINLVEGWVGIPINFRVQIRGKVFGYVASVVMFKSIVNELYNSDKIAVYAFRFSINGKEFDRELVHDSSDFYHDEKDDEYYRNFALDEVYSANTQLNLYGQNMVVNTWKKATPSELPSERRMLWILFLVFNLFSLIVTWQINKRKHLTDLVSRTNQQLRAHGKEIQIQNVRMKQLNTTKDRFFSIIAHDLRAPLSTIKALLSLISDEKNLTPELKDLISKLGRSTNSTLSLLDNLLRWAMTQTGEINYKPFPINLYNVVADNVYLLSQTASHKQITLAFDIDQELYCIGDKNMLTSVFRNLISNAIKFTPQGGTIQITSSSDDKHLSIKVKDNGIGMGTEKLNTLFELSADSAAEGTDGEPGTGLGLILCKEFIEVHNGSIEVQSTLGQGTEFIVRLLKHERGNDSND